jgi:hypothetical protein
MQGPLNIKFTLNHCINCTWSVIISVYSDCGMWHLRLHNCRSQDSVWCSDSVGQSGKSSDGPNNTTNCIMLITVSSLYTYLHGVEMFSKVLTINDLLYWLPLPLSLSYSLVLQFSQSVAYTFPIKPAHNQLTQKLSRSDICDSHGLRWRVSWQHHRLLWQSACY